MQGGRIAPWQMDVRVSPSFCHRCLVSGRNLSVFSYEKEGQFVPVKGI